MEKYKTELAAKEPKPIKVTLPDGRVMSGESWRTTPLNIAEQISKGLADNAVVSKVNDELWDLERPLESDCELKLLKFDDEEGKYVFWHSTAHLMGEAMELAYGGCLCYGPPIESGFYYDMYLENRLFSYFNLKVCCRINILAIVPKYQSRIFQNMFFKKFQKIFCKLKRFVIIFIKLSHILLKNFSKSQRW